MISSSPSAQARASGGSVSTRAVSTLNIFECVASDIPGTTVNTSIVNVIGIPGNCVTTTITVPQGATWPSYDSFGGAQLMMARPTKFNELQLYLAGDITPNFFSIELTGIQTTKSTSPLVYGVGQNYGVTVTTPRDKKLASAGFQVWTIKKIGNLFPNLNYLTSAVIAMDVPQNGDDEKSSATCIIGDVLVNGAPIQPSPQMGSCPWGL